MPALPNRFWPKGLGRSIRVPQVPLTHYLDVAAARFPDKPAIVFGGGALTFARLHERVEALAGYLRQRLGVKPGDRVLLLSQNCPQYVTACYGVLRAGAVVVPVNAMSTTAELRYYRDDSGARIAITAQELVPQVLPLLEDEPVLETVLVHAYSDALAGLADEEDLPDVVRAPREPLAHARLIAFEAALAECLPCPEESPGAGDLCVLPYTSGTTGQPKGCMHTRPASLSDTASPYGRRRQRC